MIRKVKDSDYEGLIILYMQLHGDSFPGNQTAGMDLWRKILTDERHHIIVAEEDGEIVSPCICAMILSLIHTQRPYALIENVITNSGYRKKGLTTAYPHYTEETAVSENCYKIIPLTRAKMKSTLNFYRQAGYNRSDKTALIQWL